MVVYRCIIVTIFLIGETSSVCNIEDSVDLSHGNHLSNGDVYYNGVLYEKGDYVVQNGTKRGCVCTKRHCFRKCCPYGTAYNKDLRNCVVDETVFAPEVWNDYEITPNINISSVIFHPLFGKQSCVNSTRIRISQITDNFHLRWDGKLYIEIPNAIPPWTMRTPDKYCLDTFVYEQPDGSKVTKLDALVCFSEDEEQNHYILSSTCMLVSCVFILATVAVYAWLPELANLHGKVLVAYLLCLLVAFSFLAAMQIMLTVERINIATCLGFTFIIYFSLLSAFFWLNVMCFDIWWTFSGKRGLSLEKLSTRGRFNAYAAYAFGIPSVLTALLMALEFAELPSHPLLPMLKQQGCFLYGKSKLLYLYGPIVVLCLANMIFFILTSIRIFSINKQTAVLKSKESSMHDRHRNDKQRLFLYIKLFLVMGINWILEVVSAIYPEAQDFWRYTDTYNVLIGLTIFIIFVCKRKIFRLMKKRYKQAKGEPMSRTQTTSTRTMSSRDDIQLASMKINNNFN